MATRTIIKSITWGVTAATLYAQAKSDNVEVRARSATGVSEWPTGSGCYQLSIDLDDSKTHQIAWDDGTDFSAEDFVLPPAASNGTGARTVTPTVNDGTVLGVLENALIRMTEGANSYTTTTNALGVASPAFALNDATYDVVITKDGYTFTPTTLVVDGNETPTYSMTATTITPATDPAQTTGYVTTRDGHGTAKASVTIGFRLIKGPGDAGNSYDTAQFTATSNGSGLLTVTLLRDATYVGIRGDGREFEFVTGTTSTHELPENLGVDDA